MHLVQPTWQRWQSGREHRPCELSRTCPSSHLWVSWLLQWSSKRNSSTSRCWKDHVNYEDILLEGGSSDILLCKPTYISHLFQLVLRQYRDGVIPQSTFLTEFLQQCNMYMFNKLSPLFIKSLKLYIVFTSFRKLLLLLLYVLTNSIWNWRFAFL